MLLLCLTALASPLMGSCRDEVPLGPSRPGLPPSSVLVSSDSLCARVSFTITSATAVTTTFPNRNTCTSGLVVIRGPAASWAQKPSRRLRLFVRVLNKGGQSVQLPVRVLLPPTGIKVLAPSGTPSTKIVSVTSDSSLTGGSLWLIGGSGVLAANDSSKLDTLSFNVQSPATSGQLTFQATAQSSGSTVPALPPNLIPAWVLADSSIDSLGYTKGVINVLFKPGTTQAERQSAITLIGGTVVGGLPSSTGDGYYIVAVPDDGSGAQLEAAIATLLAEPAVKDAGRDWRASRSSYRRPTDGTGWMFADWRTGPPDSATGSNWAMSAVSAPLAWGCSVGDATAEIGVIDHAFDATELAPNIIAGSGVLGQYPTEPVRHGSEVANIIAAKGNNSAGMTGMMWNAGLRLEDAGTRSPSVAQLGQLIEKLASAGAKVINFSWNWNVPWNGPPPQDTVPFIWRQLKQMMPYLRQAEAGGYLPLIVISAGNWPAKSYLTGYPILKDSFPNNVIVVGASTRPPFSRWVDASVQEESSYGSYVDVYAPGQDVTTHAATTALHSASGTSFAAPIVSGIAGLLGSFDPRLSASDIRQLIVAGAIASGYQITRGPGSTDSAPLVNAYESLRAAGRRAGAPICGFPVGTNENGQLVFYRNDGAPEVVPVPNGPVYAPSVAQGGKLIAIQIANDDYPFFSQGTWSNGSWSWNLVSGTLLNLEGRTFLEFDTVDARLNPNYGSGLGGLLLTTLTGPNRPGSRGPAITNEDLYSRSSILNGGWYDQGFITAFDPNGDWVVLAIVKNVNNLLIRAVYMLKHSDNTRFTVQEAEDGSSTDLVMRGLAWRPDGRYFVGGFQPNNAGVDPSSLYRVVQLAPNPTLQADDVVPNKYIFDVSEVFSLKGDYLYSEETALDGSSCLPVQRSFPSMSVQATVGPIGNSTCRNYTQTVFPNVRAPLRAQVRQGVRVALDTVRRVRAQRFN